MPIGSFKKNSDFWENLKILIRVVFKKVIKHKAFITNLVALASLILAFRVLASILEAVPFDSVLLTLNKISSVLFNTVCIIIGASFLRAERLHQLLLGENLYVSRRFSYCSFFYGMLLAFTPGRSAELLRFVGNEHPKALDYKKTIKIFGIEKLVDILGIVLLGGLLFQRSFELIFFTIALCIGIFYFHPKVKRYFLVFLLSLFPWLMEGFGVYIWLKIDADGEVISVIQAIAGFAGASLIGALTFVPGGIVVTEVTFIQLVNLEHPEQALVVLIAFRLLVLTMNILSGIIARLVR